ncbi:MAG: ABC transporter ATP-binding protein [Lactobacillales bacterium]|jgi:ABC-2 type transport system ATP-binding protein|nr:ABC transporter ATP-binding protein [Lactobacillales bacterium]
MNENTDLVTISQMGYKNGFKTIFRDLNLNLGYGKIIALLGENGAGKTTMMRILANIAKNSTGVVKIEGDFVGFATKSKVSYLDALSGFQKSEKLKDVIEFYQTMYADFDRERVNELMKFMKLDLDEKLGSLSKGNREKFMLVVAFSRVVPLYLLDEPLSGVDIVARNKIIQSLIKWLNEDSSIVISTHHIVEIERIVDEVVVMKDQEIIIHKSVDEIRQESANSLEDYYRKIYS